VVPVVPVVAVAVVPEVLVTVDCDVAVDGSVVLSVGKYHRAIDSYISIKRDKHCRNNCH
jgi:hypothetical protein